MMLAESNLDHVTGVVKLSSSDIFKSMASSVFGFLIALKIHCSVILGLVVAQGSGLLIGKAGFKPQHCHSDTTGPSSKTDHNYRVSHVAAPLELALPLG